MAKKPVRVAVTGAAGQIGYALLFRVASGAMLEAIAFLALAVAGKRGSRTPGAALAYYYVLVTWATVVSLAGYLRHGVPAVW